MALWRKVGIVVACGLILLGGGILVTHFASPRQPGQSSSGSVTLSQAQQIEQDLDDALTANNNGQTQKALNLYNKVLAVDPSNPAALAYAGYLEWNIGTEAHVANLVKIGSAEIQRAVRVSPTYYEGHLFYGLVLENQDHDHAGAVAQFNEYLTDAAADDVPAAEYSEVAADVAPAYQALGEPLPSQFSSPGTTTTTSVP
jgi:tetratricopeptide (TPR) repeat protein